MQLGIHCSVRNGFLPALEEAKALDCEAMQMLPYRRHHVPTAEEMAAFRSARAESGVARLLSHSRFVPNLGASDDSRQRRSVELLAMELRLSEELGAQAYVLHAGAYSSGSDLKTGIARVAAAIAQAVAETGAKIPILLENVPGGGRRMGGSLEELAELFDAVVRKSVRAGICLDTAHAWAQGYAISTAEGMLKFIAQTHRLIGTEHVGAFHLNDSRALLGSHLENHWHWGQGFVGLEGLKVLLDRPEFADVAGIVETPKGGESDRENLTIVRSRRDS